jgi:hypothetical protein
VKAKKRVVTSISRPARRRPTVRRIRSAIVPATKPRSTVPASAAVTRAPAQEAAPSSGVDLSVDLGRGLVLPNPVLVASGTFGYGVEYGEVVDVQRLGAICCKGTTLKPRIGNPTPRVAEPDAGSIAEAIAGQLALDARLVVVAGSKAMDALDPTFRALDQLGAHRERHGVPAHPGSLFWLARHGEAAIVGMPSCGLFSQATVFDLVLPRILAGDRVDARALAELGHGGLLTRDVAFRFPPYRPSRQRGALDTLEDEL